MVETTYSHVEFVQQPWRDRRKPSMWRLSTKDGSEFIGEIAWCPLRREFVLYRGGEPKLSANQLWDIADFVAKQTTIWKESRERKSNGVSKRLK